jgi:hypothetical protein
MCLIILGALPLGTHEGKVECRSDCAAKQTVFLLHGEGGRGAVAVLPVTVSKQMVWLKTFEGAVFSNPGQVDGWRQITLIQVLLGLDSQQR